MSQEPDIPALLAAKAHKLVSDLYAKQALYPESQAAFRAFIDSYEQANGAAAADSLLRRKADLQADRRRDRGAAIFLYGLLLERLSADEGGFDALSARLRLAKQLHAQDRYPEALSAC